MRCMVRDPDRLRGVPWQDAVDIVQGDVLEPATLPAAMNGVDAAYYLIHSMAAGDGFEARDCEAARHFGEAAKAAAGRVSPAGDPETSLARAIHALVGGGAEAAVA